MYWDESEMCRYGIIILDGIPYMCRDESGIKVVARKNAVVFPIFVGMNHVNNLMTL